MASKFVWSQPKFNTDGSAFDAAQFAGFELEVDGAPVVSVPLAWADSGAYELPHAPFNFSEGAHSARIRAKHVNGKVSAFSVAASWSVAPREPMPPLDFAAI